MPGGGRVAPPDRFPNPSLSTINLPGLAFERHGGMLTSSYCSLIGSRSNELASHLPIYWGCSGFYPWLECAAACRESWVSR